jgi:hypothetical protein
LGHVVVVFHAPPPPLADPVDMSMDGLTGMAA